jgi:hypothetical protein
MIFGAVAQLGARLNGIQKVVGSNPISSTFYHLHIQIPLLLIDGIIVLHFYILLHFLLIENLLKKYLNDDIFLLTFFF